MENIAFTRALSLSRRVVGPERIINHGRPSKKMISRLASYNIGQLEEFLFRDQETLTTINWQMVNQFGTRIVDKQRHSEVKIFSS